MKTEVQTELKLRWPDGWNRTLIELRKPNSQWKKTQSYYHGQIVKELELMGTTSILITHNNKETERMDPGVAVWFSMTKEDYSWQTLLGLPPAPRIDEIDQAYREKIKPLHPDRPDGGDPEMFKRMGEARKRAREWVQGTHTDRHEFVMALDRYTSVAANMAGLSRAFASFRSLQRLGMPTILERVLDKAFKAALPMNAGGEEKRNVA